MPLNLLKTLPTNIGVVYNSTGDDKYLYFVSNNNVILVVDYQGDPAVTGNISSDAITDLSLLTLDNSNLYVINKLNLFDKVANITPITKSGVASRAFDLTAITDFENHIYLEIVSAIVINEQIVVLFSLRDDHYIARFSMNGFYVQGSFTEVSVTEPLDVALAGDYIYVLTATELLRYDLSFRDTNDPTIIRTPDVPPDEAKYWGDRSSGVPTHTNTPVSLFWNGDAIVVQSEGGIWEFWGSEQPVAVGPELSTVPMFGAEMDFASKRATLERNGREILNQNALISVNAEEEEVRASFGLKVDQELYTIIFQRPLLGGVKTGDIISTTDKKIRVIGQRESPPFQDVLGVLE